MFTPFLMYDSATKATVANKIAMPTSRVSINFDNLKYLHIKDITVM